MAFTLPNAPEVDDTIILAGQTFVWTGAQWSNQEWTRQVIVSAVEPDSDNIAERDTYWFDPAIEVLKHYNSGLNAWEPVATIATMTFE